MEDINNSNVKKFVKQVSVLYQKHNDRQNARQQMDMHIDKIKSLVGVKKQKQADREVERLKRKLNEVIEKELKMTGLQYKDHAVITKQQTEINMLQRRLEESFSERVDERKEIDKLKAVVQNMEIQVNEANQIKQEREQRLMFLDKKISNEVDRENLPLRKKISELEDKYMEMKASEEVSEEKLQEFENRIDFLKRKIINPLA